MGQLGKIIIFSLLQLLYISVHGELGIVIEKCLNSTTATCVTIPADCLSNTTTCIAAVLVTPINETVIQFDYSALNDYSYMSLGFSKDEKMGDDVVIDCILDRDTGEINVYTGYNIGHKHNITGKSDAVTLIKEGIFDGVYCNFQINGEITVDKFSGPERNVETYILLALGQTQDGLPKYHHEQASVSKAIYFNSAMSKHLSILLIFSCLTGFIALNL